MIKMYSNCFYKQIQVDRSIFCNEFLNQYEVLGVQEDAVVIVKERNQEGDHYIEKTLILGH